MGGGARGGAAPRPLLHGCFIQQPMPPLALILLGRLLTGVHSPTQSTLCMPQSFSDSESEPQGDVLSSDVRSWT